MELGRLEEIEDLRKVWAHEEHDFTPWLAKPENIKELSDAIGLDISVTSTEESVGDFYADILGFETDTNNKIIIENQLEKSNHEHLGKIITYASGKDAKYIIWIVKNARDEHISAIEWLNNHTDDSIGFFLCELKLYKIGDSLIAPKFNVIEKPNSWVRTNSSGESNITRTKLPKIKDMLGWGVVKEGDVIYAKDYPEHEAILQADGQVKTSDNEILSLQNWLKNIYEWSSIETYKFSIHKETNKSLSLIRREYMQTHKISEEEN